MAMGYLPVRMLMGNALDEFISVRKLILSSDQAYDLLLR